MRIPSTHSRQKTFGNVTKIGQLYVPEYINKMDERIRSGVC